MIPSLFTQINQVIQEIHDIKRENKYIPVVNEMVHKKPLLLEETTTQAAQKEHNKHPRQDIDGKDENDGVKTCDNK
jgi:hypothetical protein